MKYKDINAFDAKTHLSELLRDAEAGQGYLILRRGKPVARLIPLEPAHQKLKLKAVAKSFRDLREGIAKRGGKIDIRGLIEEGRRS